MANEVMGAFAWVRQQLTADSALTAIVGNRIFADYAPQVDPATQLPVKYPFVLYHLQAVTDSIGAGASRIMSSPLLFVKVCGEGGGYSDVQVAADRIDAVLHKALVQSVTAGAQTFTMLGCCREKPIQYSEYLNGVRYFYSGGMYRIDIQ
jgi:hypothetical protein